MRPGLTCGFCCGAPPESNWRPHSYHESWEHRGAQQHLRWWPRTVTSQVMCSVEVSVMPSGRRWTPPEEGHHGHLRSQAQGGFCCNHGPPPPLSDSEPVPRPPGSLGLPGLPTVPSGPMPPVVVTVPSGEMVVTLPSGLKVSVVPPGNVSVRVP